MIFLRFWEDLGGPEAIKRCFLIGFLEFLKMPENQGSIWGSKSTKSIGVDAKTERAWGAGMERALSGARSGWRWARMAGTGLDS